MKKILYVGSSSQARKKLLQEMGLTFQCIEHGSSELIKNKQASFESILRDIALQKMDGLVLPRAQDGEVVFVLTADSMGKDVHGVIHGKPRDKEDAVAKIKALREGGIVATAFCLDRKRYKQGSWHLEERITGYVQTTYVFDMPDAWIPIYLEKVPQYKDVSGAITVEGFGAQFLKSISGSYTTILGLPVFEVREALEKIGYF